MTRRRWEMPGSVYELMTTGGVDARAEAAAYEARMSEYRFWLEILDGWRMDCTADANAGDEAAGRAARWLVHEIARIKRILGERQPRDLDKVCAQTRNVSAGTTSGGETCPSTRSAPNARPSGTTARSVPARSASPC